MAVAVRFGQSWLREDGGWSENPADAGVFVDGAAATAFVAAHPVTFSSGTEQKAVTGGKNKNNKSIT